MIISPAKQFRCNFSGQTSDQVAADTRLEVTLLDSTGKVAAQQHYPIQLQRSTFNVQRLTALPSPLLCQTEITGSLSRFSQNLRDGLRSSTRCLFDLRRLKRSQPQQSATCLRPNLPAATKRLPPKIPSRLISPAKSNCWVMICQLFRKLVQLRPACYCIGELRQRNSDYLGFARTVGCGEPAYCRPHRYPGQRRSTYLNLAQTGINLG